MKQQQIVRQLTVLIINFAFLTAMVSVGVSSTQAQFSNSNDKIFRQFAKPDAVTNLIRNKTSEFFRVNINSPADLQNVGESGKIIEDYGSFVILAKRDSAALENFDASEIETSINLPAGSFEPLENSPVQTVKANRAENIGGKDYYVVQVGGIARGEWLKSFEETGAEVIQYVPHQAFFVYADASAIAKIAGHSKVRWVGKYEASQKVADFTDQYSARQESGFAEYDVSVFSRADLAIVKNQIANLPGASVTTVMDLQHNFFNTVRVKIPISEVGEIARLRDVFRVDPYIRPEIEDERAAQIVAGNYVNTTTLNPPGYNPAAQFGVDGTNVTVAVADDGISIPGNGGFYITSANTVDGPLRGATSGASGGHGHINASIIAGAMPFGPLDPLGYNYGLGIAPKSNIINIPFLKSGNTTNDQQSLDDTLNTAGPNGVKGNISNNSWGNGTNGNSYDSYAAMYDGFVQDASLAATIDPINVIFSAGNSGNSGLTRPKVAKNVISVGNSENIRTELSVNSANNIDDLSSTSSRGPATDGRIKPDIAAPGSAITGSRAGSGASVSGFVDAVHAFSFGTSHAAPQIAGVAALFTQFWKNGHADANPSPSLVKSAILNTGEEMNGVGTSTPIPNGNEGWGRVNLSNLFNTGVGMKFVNEETVFSNVGENIAYSGSVARADKATRITLVWTDPPGAGNPALVNDLDLTVNIGGSVYKGNVFNSGNSTIGGTSDTLNNVESVRIPSGIAAGTPITITVRAIALNGDGVLGNNDTTDQHFSLTAYNFGDAPTPAPTSAIKSDFDGDGRADVSVFRPSNGTWYVNGSTAGFTAAAFGQNGDKIVPGDYDADGRTDFAVFRSGTWYIQRSQAGFTATVFGAATDLPVQADFDGDGKTDVAVFRPSNGVWYIQGSTAGFSAITFGAGSDRPVQGDYDGDGKADVAVFRPSNGTWYMQNSTAGFSALAFGFGSDITTPGDFDGDGKTDIAVFRPSNGTWYIQNSAIGFSAVQFGQNGDVPVQSDFDGDGKTDVAVFRDGNWYLLNSSDSVFNAVFFGFNTDKPTQTGYLP